MAVKIEFDSAHNAIQPTMVLMTRKGRKLGSLPAVNAVFKDCFNNYSDFSFRVNKEDCKANEGLWEQIVDFKLLLIREWNKLFEIYVDVEEANDTVKNVSAKSLGEAELSQINLYDIEINTELDISRDDYEPTVLYKADNKNASLLSRITEKIPHYKIKSVSSSIANIQRTFTFDNKSIHDAFQEIAEEINCLFIIDCRIDENGKIVREISVVDLEANCLDCRERGEFSKECPKCGGTNISSGYGKDTTIFVSVDNLADSITLSTDEGSVKNCFKLEAGDDLMTATIANCNPNGSSYIWRLSDSMKADMSEALRNRLEEYDEEYSKYSNDYEMFGDGSDYSDIIDKYNDLIEEYVESNSGLKKIKTPIMGYSNLMQYYYDTIDFYLYLNNGMMPSIETSEITADSEIEKLNSDTLSPVAVKDLSICSKATADSSVLAMAKAIINNRYQVKITESEFSDYDEKKEYRIWRGKFVVTSYSNEEDTATTENPIEVEVNDDYEKYVRQKIEKTMKQSSASDEITDIIELFGLNSDEEMSDSDDNDDSTNVSAFRKEVKKYSLSRLISFYDCCQSCIDVLIEQGIGDNHTWASKTPDLYATLYVPYRNKLGILEKEISIRENEIAVITGRTREDGNLLSNGVQNALINERNKIQSILDFESFVKSAQDIGEDLWIEFSSYRREDTYENSNYISDGLDNAQLFDNARKFIEIAQKDIYKSSNSQHSISAKLKNLLVMEEFEPIVKYFEVGNWIRVRIDGEIYRLRLLDYEIDFENLNNISITFSDVTNLSSGQSDISSVLSQASSIASSYESTKRQVETSKEKINSWVNDGLALTKMKIVDNADNQNVSWDSHGILCREYLPLTDNYDDKQLKIINKGLYLTDDNWLTSKAGIGNFSFYNPKTGKMEESYGVIADKLVGNLILSEEVGVYNSNNSISLGENGLVITTDSKDNQTAFTIRKKSVDTEGEEQYTDLMYVDSKGNLVLNGSLHIETQTSGSSTSKPLQDSVEDIMQDKINYTRQYADNILNNYKSETSQYMNFSPEGLTIGSNLQNEANKFTTLINNTGMYFKAGETPVAYITNQQLNINSAIIKQSLNLGNFYFVPRQDDKGFSIAWHDNKQVENEGGV